jgi:hypothetical protein
MIICCPDKCTYNSEGGVIHEYGAIMEWWLAGESRINSERNLHQCHIAHHECPVKSPGIQTDARWWVPRSHPLSLMWRHTVWQKLSYVLDDPQVQRVSRESKHKTASRRLLLTTCLLNPRLKPVDWGNACLRNVGEILPVSTASHPITYCSESLP